MDHIYQPHLELDLALDPVPASVTLWIQPWIRLDVSDPAVDSNKYPAWDPPVHPSWDSPVYPAMDTLRDPVVALLEANHGFSPNSFGSSFESILDPNIVSTSDPAMNPFQGSYLSLIHI